MLEVLCKNRRAQHRHFSLGGSNMFPDEPRVKGWMVEG